MAKKVYDFDYDRQPSGVWVKIDTDEGNKKGKVNIPTYLTYNQLGTAIKQLLVKQGYDIAVKQPVLDDKILAKAESSEDFALDKKEEKQENCDCKSGKDCDCKDDCNCDKDDK